MKDSKQKIKCPFCGKKIGLSNYTLHIKSKKCQKK